MWHSSDNETGRKNVTMELSSDRSHLRVREAEPDDHDPEEINMTTDLVKIRLHDIIRIEVGKPRSSKDSASSSSLPTPSTHKFFSISTSNSDGDTSTHGFDTESTTDRDGIISALKVLFEQTKTSSFAKHLRGKDETQHSTQEENPMDEPPDLSRTRMNKSQTNASPKATSNTKQQSVRVERNTNASGDEGTELSLVGFDINPANHPIDSSSEEIEITATDKRMPTLDEETISAMLPMTPRKTAPNVPHEAPETNSSDDDARDISYVGSDGEDIRDRNSSSDGDSSETVSEVQTASTDAEGQELSVTIIESSSLKNESVEVTGSEWSESAEWGNGTKQAKNKATNNVISHSAEDKGKSSVTIIARRPNTLADVEEFELLAIANQMANPWCTDDICASAFSNQIAEPWCTDDICTAAFKDVAETCKGIFDMKQQEKAVEKARNEGQQELFEDYIAGVLGAPSAMASMLSVGDVFNSARMAPPKSEASHHEVNRIRNRAWTPNAQALRLKNLRSEMTFEAAQRHNREKMHFVQTVTSVDDIELSRRRRKKKKRPIPSETDFTDFDSAALLQQVVGNIIPNEDTAEDEEILYYDSDPECSRVRTHSRGPRRVHADRLNAIENATRNRRRTLSGIPINRLMAGRRMKKMDEGLVSDIIEVSKTDFVLVETKMSDVWIILQN